MNNVAVLVIGAVFIGFCLGNIFQIIVQKW